MTVKAAFVLVLVLMVVGPPAAAAAAPAASTASARIRIATLPRPAPSRAAPTVRGWAHSQERAALTGKDRGGALVRGQSSRQGGLICRRIAVPVLQSDVETGVY